MNWPFVPSSSRAGLRRAQQNAAGAYVSASALSSYIPPSVNVAQGQPLGTGINAPTVVPPSLRLGPVPKLAAGSGYTGAKPASGQAGTLAMAGYVSEEPTYEPVGFEYQPPYNPVWTIPIPRSFPYADPSQLFAPTYRSHDFAPAQRFFNQARSAMNWQQTDYPVPARMLTPHQNPAIYNFYNAIALARPLDQNSFFIAPYTNPAVAPTLGSFTMKPLGA